MPGLAADGAPTPALLKKLAALGADAVIITQGLSKSDSTSYRYFGGSVQERTAVMVSENESSATVIAMSAVGVAPLESDFVKGSLQTRFFNTGSTEMAWSALTSFVNDGRKADACWDFSNQLTKALADASLVKLNDKKFAARLVERPRRVRAARWTPSSPTSTGRALAWRCWSTRRTA